MCFLELVNVFYRTGVNLCDSFLIPLYILYT